MKKILASLLACLTLAGMFAFTGIAAAATEHKAITLLTSLESWLNNDNWAGIKYVNGSLRKARVQAVTWHENALLQEFVMDYKEGGTPENGKLSCKFIFSAADLPGQIAESACPMGNAEITLASKTTKNKTGNMGVITLLQRDLVPKLKNNVRFIALLENGMLGSKESADISVNFQLLKDAANATVWKVTFFDSKSGKKLVGVISATATRPRFTFVTLN